MAETTTTFGVAAGLQDYLVGDDVHIVRVVAAGGSGHPGASDDPGRGARVTCLLPVTPGEVLKVAVGRAGTAGSVSTPTPNGDTVGRGGRGPYPGGASSHLKRATTRLLVAGAGGGASSSSGFVGGGHGGGDVGGSGRGFGNPGLGGGADPTYVTGDGEAPGDDSGSGGGGQVGGRAGRYGAGGQMYAGGGGGSSKAPAGAVIEAGVNLGHGQVSITAGLAPLAGSITSPASAAVIDASRPLPVVTVFAGASGSDTQSAVQVRSGDGQVFTGGSDPVVLLPAASLALGERTLQVRHVNQHGTWGPWSSPQPVMAGTAPAAPALTSPVSGDVLTTTPSTAAWSATGQVAYRLRRLADAEGTPGTTVLWDSGLQPGAATTATVDWPVDGRYEWLAVSITDATGLESAPALARVRVQRTRPATPTAAATAVTTSVTGVPGQTDAIDVVITNPAEAGRPAVDHCEIWAGEPGALRQVNTAPVPPNSTFRWSTPPSGVDLAVVVVAVAASGATARAAATGSPARGFGHGPFGRTPFGH